MLPATQPKNCLTCGKTVKGRTDKKYCDDNCRNSFNNHLKADRNNYVRNINNTLRRNRRILENVLPEKGEIAKTSRDKLINKGFLLKYITHTSTNKKGVTYFFCYEYGYLPLENDQFLIVKRKQKE